MGCLSFKNKTIINLSIFYIILNYERERKKENIEVIKT